MKLSHPLIDRIIRSGRKTMALEVNRNAEVIVRIPYAVPDAMVHHFIQSHISWIEKKRREAREKRKTESKSFKAGEQFYYLGNLYPLRLSSANGSIMMDFKDAFYLHPDYVHDARKIFISWYNMRTRSLVLPLVKKYAKRMHVRFGRINITRAEKRWGSCSTKGSINFSYRLAMLPEHLVEYIVVHELAHRKEMNHSPDFWNIVRYFLPDYKERRRELKNNGYLYSI